MKKALPHTKVTVKLRRSNYKEEWYLIIESYLVYKRGSKRASRVVESINRTISTPIWDKSSIARILPDGTFNYKPCLVYTSNKKFCLKSPQKVQVWYKVSYYYLIFARYYQFIVIQCVDVYKRQVRR